jgi:hypothetical protein
MYQCSDPIHHHIHQLTRDEASQPVSVSDSDYDSDVDSADFPDIDDLPPFHQPQNTWNPNNIFDGNSHILPSRNDKEDMKHDARDAALEAVESNFRCCRKECEIVSLKNVKQLRLTRQQVHFNCVCFYNFSFLLTTVLSSVTGALDAGGGDPQLH